MINYTSMAEKTKLKYSEMYEKRERTLKYLMELKTENILFSHYTEAGLIGHLNYTVTAHGGWDAPLCHIRGTFAGHWLSAAAHIINETGDVLLKAKADHMVSEIARCQDQNGDGWAFPIPQKYLLSLKAGKGIFWAPQYVCHKNMMGLLEMYNLVGNAQALEIIKPCADWFYRFNADITRENMDDMMDRQETGAMMEFWADLYAVTGDEKHLELMRKYERPRNSEPISRGIDKLTNRHANTMVPEIHGCARAYEVTGEEEYRAVVENFWNLAVRDRGWFATGGQTTGEVWAPAGRELARLSETNQEHCVVYNMIRLADYLYRWTGKAEYADYIEMNIHNGILAQGFWQSRGRDMLCETHEEPGIVTYYLPLDAGSVKKWGGKTDDFWCCHCTAVQANARFNDYIFYQDVNNAEITVAQYIASELKTEINGIAMLLTLEESDTSNGFLKIGDTTYDTTSRPDFNAYTLSIKADSEVEVAISFRLPWWMKGAVECEVDGASVACEVRDGYLILKRKWSENKVTVLIKKGITCHPLADAKDTVAFLDGPVLLAGLVAEQRMIVGDIEHPETFLQPHFEREWSNWLAGWQTIGQAVNFKFVPIKHIGREIYTVYFPVKKL